MSTAVAFSYIGGIAALNLVTVLLRGRVPDAAALALGWLAMLLVGYPATRYFSGNLKLSFARWAAVSTLGAAVAAIFFVLW